MGALISPLYLEEQRRLHAAPRGYGQRGRKWAETVNTLIADFHAQSVLDYGCGQGSLAPLLTAPDVREYDPAIPGKDGPPDPADLVICTDVLEHVEPEHLLPVLRHLGVLTRRGLFVVVSLVETAKTLSDGRQAHINLQTADWWRECFTSLGWKVDRELNVKPEKQWVAVLCV